MTFSKNTGQSFTNIFHTINNLPLADIWSTPNKPNLVKILLRRTSFLIARSTDQL